jgi:hypothetical protein
MIAYLSENASQILDGLLFGLGVLAVYLGAVFTAALVRSLGGAGSRGLTLAGRYVQGWFDHVRGDDRNTINVTLNMIVDNRLKFETLVADRRVWYVWPNSYRVQMIRRAARRTTIDNPVIRFPERAAKPQSLIGKFLQRWRERVHNMIVSAHIVENGKTQRVRLIREDDYKATYGPLISLVSEKCNNDNAIDVALGHSMEEHRFVIALTFEQLHNRRARHLRAMVMWEEALRELPPDCPQVDFEEHRTRFRTLQAISRQYATHPHQFGIVKVWRPKRLSATMPSRMALPFDEALRRERSPAAE